MANLTKDQLEQIRTRLLARQRVLVGEVKEKREQAAAQAGDEAMGVVGDAGDESVLRMNTDLDIQEAGRDAEELDGIESALRRMDDDTYGTCDECGQEIGFRRLEVQPTATRCIADQEKHEKTYAHRATPTL